MKERSKKEAHRLAELYSFAILDTPSEQQFDELLFLATEVCQVPMAYISFIDSERQWFKAQFGLDKVTLSRDSSICEKMISDKNPLYLTDLESNPRYQDYKKVLNKPLLKFYGGVPLVTISGTVIGSLCILDEKTRNLKEEQGLSLEFIAKSIMNLLELRKIQSQTKFNQEENKKLQSRLTTVGEMANGIAHEINNPLAIIMGSCHHLINQINKDQLQKNVMLLATEKINSSAVRIEKIIKSMSRFSRSHEKDQYERTSIMEIVRETVDLFEESFICAEVELKIINQIDVMWYGNPIQLSQVLFNLINNSFFAVEKYTEKWVEVDVSILASHDLMITVTDSGHGIIKEIADKIMKPFFTTKAAGKGTGLGLSISKDIVESHGGSLSIDHACPNTRFVIKLPLGG